MLLLTISLVLVAIHCQNVNDSDPSVKENTSPVIVYTNIGEWYARINVIENDVKTTLFSDDTVTRSFADLNLKRKKIVYMRNFALYPMMGSVGEPSITVAGMDGTDETTLLPYNAVTGYFYPVWISETEVAVFRQTRQESLSLLILDGATGAMNGEVTLDFSGNIYGCIMEKVSDSLLCVQCGNRYLAIVDIMVKGIRKDTTFVPDSNEYLAVTRPLVKDGDMINFTSSRYPFSYLQYSCTGNAFRGYKFPVDSLEVLAISGEKLIVYDHDSWSNSKLMCCDRNFNVEGTFSSNAEEVIYWDGRETYCVSEGNDVYVILKINFADGSYSMLNEPVENNFILDARVYF